MLLSGHDFILKFIKGHFYIISVAGVLVRVLCILSVDA